ncbi:ribosomal RNA small subunit methyltransferase nep-1-like [Neltuma alba]|uniref:ribosomal RNA small subunit methyltransferase nep-1-like n=1 Tax=Neltuma alba TaxID=207710 RepID=UPI0010A3A01B|nr:ribosomal RNA small subunit methyltransferase nep-1-like [Prosopis alba]
MVPGNDQSTGNEEHNDGAVEELSGIQPAPRSQSSEAGVYFILEGASLCVANVGKKYQILNPDDHATFLRKQNKNPYDFRPDIVHEALLQIMSSRLRMAGRLRAVFIRTSEGVLVKVSPHANIPKTLAGFCDMMVELLQKFRIKAKSNHATLLRVIKNPVTKHLPINSHKIGLSFSSSKTAQLRGYISNAAHHENFVFVVGAMAHGKIEADYVDDLISVSGYPLSAGTCLRRICIALEKNWKIM